MLARPLHPGAPAAGAATRAIDALAPAAAPRLQRTGLPTPAGFLQVLVQTLRERTAILVQLPALWDMARGQVRDLIAARLSQAGIPLDRVEVVQRADAYRSGPVAARGPTTPSGPPGPPIQKGPPS